MLSLTALLSLPTLLSMTTFGVQNLPDMTGRSVIVTGANSGIGRAAARAFAGAGARVVLAVRDTAKGETAAAAMPGTTEVRAAGSREPRVGPRVRRRLERAAGPARQQRGRHGAAAVADRRGLRAAVRHEPPGPLRPDESAAPRHHRARGDGLLDRAPGRDDRLRRPQLGAQALQALARLRAVEAREPPLHRRAAAPADRGRLRRSSRPRPTPATRPRTSSSTAASA